MARLRIKDSSLLKIKTYIVPISVPFILGMDVLESMESALKCPHIILLQVQENGNFQLNYNMVTRSYCIIASHFPRLHQSSKKQKLSTEKLLFKRTDNDMSF